MSALCLANHFVAFGLVCSAAGLYSIWEGQVLHVALGQPLVTSAPSHRREVLAMQRDMFADLQDASFFTPRIGDFVEVARLARGALRRLVPALAPAPQSPPPSCPLAG